MDIEYITMLRPAGHAWLLCAFLIAKVQISVYSVFTYFSEKVYLLAVLSTHGDHYFVKSPVCLWTDNQ